MQKSPGPGKRGSFDFVHIRRLAGVVSDWRELILGAYKPIKPGRYLGVAEYGMKWYSDDSTPKGLHGIYRYHDLRDKAATTSSASSCSSKRLDSRISATTFTSYLLVSDLPILG